MRIQKNNLTQQQFLDLKPLIRKFIVESGCTLDHERVLQATLQNVLIGNRNPVAHDTWIFGETEGYCLGRAERDADGQLVYTAYQLWLDPKIRDGVIVRDWIDYLQVHAQQSGYVRLYIISSRLDCIRAYARGLGRNFRAQTVTFVAKLGEIQ